MTDPRRPVEIACPASPELDLGMRLSPFGVKRDELAALATNVHAIRRLLDNNPRDPFPAMHEAAAR